jgi:hypothetical protein
MNSIVAVIALVLLLFGCSSPPPFAERFTERVKAVCAEGVALAAERYGMSDVEQDAKTRDCIRRLHVLHPAADLRRELREVEAAEFVVVEGAQPVGIGHRRGLSAGSSFSGSARSSSVRPLRLPRGSTCSAGSVWPRQGSTSRTTRTPSSPGSGPPASGIAGSPAGRARRPRTRR